MNFHLSLLVLFGLLMGPFVFMTPCAARQSDGYLWANFPSITTPYNPPTAYSYNSARGPITITRTDVGQYENFFARLCAGSSGKHSFAQASSYDNNNYICHVVQWGFLNNGIQVFVQCFNLAGQAVDSYYLLNVICNS